MKKAARGRADLSRYYGLLKDCPILDELEADSRKVRDSAKSRI